MSEFLKWCFWIGVCLFAFYVFRGSEKPIYEDPKYEQGHADAVDEICLAARRELDSEEYAKLQPIAGCGY